jgi:surfactin synthase thioesterase subunit
VAALPAQRLLAPITAFWSEQTRANRGDRLPSWQRYTRGEAREHVVVGDHGAVLCDPSMIAAVTARLR